jgi:hypothetical protein
MTNDFDPNDRAAITAALASDDPQNPIARAVAARLDAMTKAFEEASAATGGLPDQIEISKPLTVLDEIVIDLFRLSLSGISGAPPVIVLGTQTRH